MIQPVQTDYAHFSPRRAYAGYIFDCDGTLADTMPMHHAAWNHSLKVAGATFEFPYALMCQWGGKSMRHTLEDLNRMHACSLDLQTVRKAQAEFFSQGTFQIKPVEPIVAIARSLHGKFPIAVASGGQKAHVFETLKTIGVDSIFNVVVTQEDVVNNKPAPDIFLLAAKKMGVEPSECLVYEDSPTGISAAMSAGMDYIKVEF